MAKFYTLEKGERILKMAKTSQEILDYRNSFPLEERIYLILGIIIPPVPFCWKDEVWRWN